MQTTRHADLDISLVSTRADLVAAGYQDRTIARLVRDGSLVRIRQGAYADGPLWRSLDDVGRHRLRARAVLRRAGTEVALSHVSAVLEHGGPTWGLDLSDVHITRLDHHAGRREAGVAQHRGTLVEAEVGQPADVPVVSPARCVAEILGTLSTEVALVVAHDLIHRRLTDSAAIRSAIHGMERWPGTLGAHIIHPLLDVPCESVAETRFLHLITRLGLPRPIAQYEVHGPAGQVIARLDFAWPEYGVWVEVDGRAKYDAHLGPGETASDVVWREKLREDDVRHRTGWRCLRVTWADLQVPGRLARLLRDFLAGRDREPAAR